MDNPKTKYEAKARCQALIDRMSATEDRAEWLSLDAEARRVTALAERLPMGEAPRRPRQRTEARPGAIVRRGNRFALNI